MIEKDRGWAGRMLESDKIDIHGLIATQNEYQVVLALHQEAHKHNVNSDVKEAIAEKLRELDK